MVCNHLSKYLLLSVLLTILTLCMTARGGMDKLQHPEAKTACQELNLAENWRRWKQRFELFLIAPGNNDKPDDVQSALLLHIVGLKPSKSTIPLHGKPKMTKRRWAKSLRSLRPTPIPEKNITWERHAFNSRNQQSGETINKYATDLLSKARTCEFETLTSYNDVTCVSRACMIWLFSLDCDSLLAPELP